MESLEEVYACIMQVPDDKVFPTCKVIDCLYRDIIYCTADPHNITPNSLQCSKYLQPEIYKEFDDVTIH
jgi:hypothetical protein